MTSIELLKQDLDAELKLGTKMIVNWDMYIEMHKQEMTTNCSQQEISDEKILDAAEEHSDSFLNRGVAMSSFARGCYWYREQLKGDA